MQTWKRKKSKALNANWEFRWKIRTPIYQLVNQDNYDKMKVKVSINHSVIWLWDPMDCMSVFSVHGILQARMLKWVAIPFSRESSNPGIGSPTLQTEFLLSEPPGKPLIMIEISAPALGYKQDRYFHWNKVTGLEEVGLWNTRTDHL